jgi:hypothetical protein
MCVGSHFKQCARNKEREEFMRRLKKLENVSIYSRLSVPISELDESVCAGTPSYWKES